MVCVEGCVVCVVCVGGCVVCGVKTRMRFTLMASYVWTRPLPQKQIELCDRKKTYVKWFGPPSVCLTTDVTSVHVCACV